ncbi:SAM-dependent methyltransferase [Halalkaliarchaeum desulfuricum]|uniref:SAM-dependent methyltransferase n=1 Tax=Halalkaliarchaeum desulfuricum TaxID=2055893 RepID=A0A343TFF7_9EURY|nr:class I SAM-dependent methyltransferase [Halalkaliarchaeum desulfuricum]AUX07829.1 SAM-dependent methyltransferase [Halalkaliarchaeum desulfuricum]
MTESDTDARNNERTDETNASCAITPGEDGDAGISADWAKRVWSAGSYAETAPSYLSMAAALVEKTAVSPEDEVLDVGCGTGNVAITAARRGASVTGIDISPTLLEQARTNAETAGVEDVSWQEGDATALPFEDNSFDVVLSNLGHMYGDPPEAATRELLRVTRPGGRIGVTSWTPSSLYPSMGGVAMSLLTPEDLPDFSAPPFLWGDPGTVRDRFGDAVETLQFETDTVQYPALSPDAFREQTVSTSGLFIEILDGVDDSDRQTLRKQLTETIEPYFDERANAVELEYLLSTATVN